MSSNNKKHVAVLMGGWSGEREVSLTSGAGVAAAARDNGYHVTEIDVTRDIPKLIKDLTPKPDVAINILHGQWGEDGHVQAILNILGIPYTFSGMLSSAVAMDKSLSKCLFEKAGIPTPAYKIVDFDKAFDGPQMDVPYVIKPIAEGSSLGVFIVDDLDNLPKKPDNWTYGDKVLVEEYIPGQEISSVVIGDKGIGVLELAPKAGFYDYDAKYVDGKTEHFMPARMPEDDYQRCCDLAVQAHKVLGCRGVSRTDLRYNPKTKDLYVLEVNTQPGFTPLSIVPEVAAYAGMSYKDLIKWMVENASCGQN